jgi:restriction endonuclease S subunit
MDKFESTINQIRDILRKEGITGMDSIKHCLLFMFMKFLTSEKCKQLKIDTIYSFEKISELTDANEMKERVFVKGKMCLVNLLKKDNIFTVDFKLQSNANLKTIIGKISAIDFEQLSLKTDIVGIIYELHLKSGTSQAMRDLGQYFTNREVIEWMVKLTNPKIANKKTGEIEKILDPSMGTGGFLTMAIKHLNETNNKIDWATNKNNIYGFDIDENVTQMSLLNAFIETGLLFDKTIIKHDSLHKDYMIDDGKTFIDKVDVILANEPFGLKNITHAECCERIKELKIRGTKAEPLFLQLMMLSLNTGGRCAVVVPDGVLFNDSNLHTGTREYLVSNLNLKKVTSLNGDFFLNTGVKSSVLYFVNDGLTNQVEFSELVMDEGKLKENTICNVGLKDIVANGYSLFVNKYNTVEEKKLDGIKYMKLGDICELKIGGTPRRNINEYWNNGTNVWVSISELDNNVIYNSKEKITNEGVKNSNVKLLKKGTILMSFKMSLGKKGIAGVDLYTNEAIVGINSLDSQKILNKYIYYMINKFDFSQACSSIATGNMNKDKLENIQIPIPSMEKQMEIVETLDVFYDQIERNVQSIKAYERIKKGIVWANTTNCDNMKKLGDVCEIKGGKRLEKGEQYLDIESNWYYLQVCDILNIQNDKFKYISEENFKKLSNYKLNKNEIVISIAGTIGNIGIFTSNKNVILTENACKLILSSKEILLKYIYYYLNSKNAQHYFYKSFKQATIPKLSLDSIKNTPFVIPSKEIQELIVKECEYWDEQIDRLKKENEKLKGVPVIEMCLAGESAKSTQTLDQQPESDDESEQEQLDEESESDEEPVEIEYKKKPYIRIGTNVYVKTEKGRGELYGTWNASTNKVTKVTKEFNV